MTDQWAIFLALIALLPVRFAFFRLRSPFTIWIFVGKCVFPVYGPDQQNDNKYHTCEFMIFQILLWICNKNVICKMHFWYLFVLMHFVFIFLQKCVPCSCQKHIFENQLWAISLQKSTFWSFGCPKWRISGPSFWHLSLFCPFCSPFFSFSRPSEF